MLYSKSILTISLTFLLSFTYSFAGIDSIILSDCAMIITNEHEAPICGTRPRIDIWERPCEGPQSKYYLYFKDIGTKPGEGYRDTLYAAGYHSYYWEREFPFREGGTYVIFDEITPFGDTCRCIDSGYFFPYTYDWPGYSHLNDVKFRSIDINPNPADNFVSLTGFESIGSLQIFNLLGEQVLRLSEPGTVINISDLPSGMYTLVFDDGNKNVGRFVKQ